MSNNDSLSLGTERIWVLLRQYAVPSIVAMTASSLYNMVDSIFIGQGVGTLAIAGLAITFPFMNLAAAFGAMVGVGASTVISVKLGQKDVEGAEHAMGNVVLLNIMIGLIFMVVSLSFLDNILIFFGASEATLPYARDYMKIILYGNLITHVYLGLNAVMRSSGYPRSSMYTTLFAVVINGLFNYLFIFVFNMGIKGSALGTVLAQILALLVVLWHFSRPSTFLRFKLSMFKFRLTVARNILAIGLSPFFINVCACLVVMLINNGLKTHGGDLYIGAYGINNRIIFFFIMIVMGLNQGMQPIVGYNYGARKLDRVMSGFKMTVISAVAVTTIGFLICQCFPKSVISLFTKDSELIEISEHALRIITFIFPVVGYQMVATNLFQSVGLAKKAIFLSLNRQMLFLIPFLIVLPKFFGAEGVWWSMPMADFVSSIVVSILLIHQIKQFKAEYQKN
ncbi:MAG: MATE family efflux transporter [Bacteroidia bacterium]|nr:MATE family efflux transporter [Bacteroidia bacterium]